ncbi:transposase [Corallococcus exercitus]|uniref:Transposase IS4-like domain-containing protein n=1 Tax=Corallococcus exercitus TaxID=2316736 RepID=A0A7Y4JMD1_9BACT|nr:transposase [Corallococcus exercitus]NOK07696.1 hypothetical protein [Corallococcus exercitus]
MVSSAQWRQRCADAPKQQTTLFSLRTPGDQVPAGHLLRRVNYSLNGVMESRSGLLADLAVMPANGFAERETAVMMLEGLKSRNERASVGDDKGYNTVNFVADCWCMGVTPHIAQMTDTRRRSAIDRRTTRLAGYALIQRARKRIEEVWGWMKTVGALARRVSKAGNGRSWRRIWWAPRTTWCGWRGWLPHRRAATAASPGGRVEIEINEKPRLVPANRASSTAR